MESGQYRSFGAAEPKNPASLLFGFSCSFPALSAALYPDALLHEADGDDHEEPHDPRARSGDAATIAESAPLLLLLLLPLPLWSPPPPVGLLGA